MGIESDICKLQNQMEDVQAQLGIVNENTSYRFKVYHSNMQESMFIGPTFNTLHDAKDELQIVIEDIKLKRRILNYSNRSKTKKELLNKEIENSKFINRYDNIDAFDSSAYGNIMIGDSTGAVESYNLYYINFDEIELIKIVAVQDESTYYKF